MRVQQQEICVLLGAHGSGKKIAIIKTVRALADVSLQEAKDMVERQAPSVILRTGDAVVADVAIERLRLIGAEATSILTQREVSVDTYLLFAKIRGRLKDEGIPDEYHESVMKEVMQNFSGI